MIGMYIGLTLFLVGLVWWIAGMVYSLKDHELTQMWVGLIVLNVGNIVVQISALNMAG